MRTSLAALALVLFASAARAEDTKPPQIADVKASARSGKVLIEARITDETGVLSAIVHHRAPGGRVEDTPMVKNDFDDVFKARFAGGGDTEYWIEATDLLGNGPAAYGSSGKAFSVSGKPASAKSVARAEAPPAAREEPPAPPSTQAPKEPTPEPQKARKEPTRQAQKRREELAPKEKEEAKAQPQRPVKLASAEPAAASAPAAAAQKPSPFVFSDYPPARVLPGRPILLRAQIVPNGNGPEPERVAVLWRAGDGQDQLTDMSPDASGGWGGYRAELPAQAQGALFYQIVACDAGASRCGVDTGSKRKWHAAAVSAQPGAAQPTPIDALSAKAPAAIPE